MSPSLYNCPTIEEILGLKNPFPITKQLNPIKKNIDEKVSNAIEACPSVIISAPKAVAFRYPKNLSAIRPPNMGVK